MLTYMEVHLYYTLPVLFLLLLLLRPFHSAQDSVKYLFLCTMALSTATPWDNYIVYHRAWSYCSNCVVAVIGYVPLEEYMFFAIMTMMTVAFTNLVMRWHLAAFFLKSSDPFQTKCVRYIPIVGFLSIGMKAFLLAIPNTPLFYGACILWYVCPVLALLWYGAGPYICRRWKGVLTSILVPTFYLCWVDQVAIGAGTWHISERTSSKIMIVPHLPLEEFMFFFLINVVLVFATCALDRAYAVLSLYSSTNSSTQHMTHRLNMTTMTYLFKAFCVADEDLDPLPLDDLNDTWTILKQGSASFYTASAVFPSEQRQDLGILYGFCRATDDLADDEAVPTDQRKRKLDLVRSFVVDMFNSKTNTAADIDWAPFQDDLPKDCLASMRCFVRLRHVLDIGAIMELLDGYEWDLAQKPITDEADLKHYAACVASSVGEMCTRILLKHHPVYGGASFVPSPVASSVSWIIARARDMGLILQYTNIARDIVIDSQTLGRCYLPLTWLSPDECDLFFSRRARRLGDDRLRSLAVNLLDMADQLQPGAQRAIEKLPMGCQGGVRAACGVYCGIGQALKSAEGYPTRAHVSKLHRAWLALAHVYALPSWTMSHRSFKATLTSLYNSLPSIFLSSSPASSSYQRKGKVRAFYIE
ncbi:Lycopene beta-cyclase [Hesseltinella vesiculosa]|uniref:Bifunctional lycopene cyclase/phytoene synthase n=1 Tax=Hesseltinella vesiculosa TaxID=101127 RepID=A0A1X2GTC4_9FUNG|nr:Lycopene beta-cyclase [Hesseltinella vesiculosa]